MNPPNCAAPSKVSSAKTCSHTRMESIATQGIVSSEVKRTTTQSTLALYPRTTLRAAETVLSLLSVPQA